MRFTLNTDKNETNDCKNYICYINSYSINGCLLRSR